MKTNEMDIQAVMARDNRLVSLEILPAYRIRLGYTDGQEYVIDFSAWLQSGVLVQLQDSELFAQARIGPQGRSLEFPGGIDFCADALRVDAEAQRA